MALFTQHDLKAFIPEAYQVMATDDESIGVMDASVFASIHDASEGWIGGYLEQAGLAIPEPAPRRIKLAAMRFAEYTIWDRRGDFARSKAVYDTWIKTYEKWLERIATGAETLAPGTETPADVLTEPARTYDPAGRLMI